MTTLTGLGIQNAAGQAANLAPVSRSATAATLAPSADQVTFSGKGKNRATAGMAGVALALAALLSGCGGASNATEPSTPETSVTQTATPSETPETTKPVLDADSAKVKECADQLQKAMAGKFKNVETSPVAGFGSGSTVTTFSADAKEYALLKIVNPTTETAETVMLISNANVAKFEGDYAVIIDDSNQSASCATYENRSIAKIKENQLASDQGVTKEAIALVKQVNKKLGNP